MNIVKFIGILICKLKYIILIPLVVGGLTFFMTKDLPKVYNAETTIYTGITTNSGLDVSSVRVDKLITQNEYSNVMSILKSNSLFEEVALRLLAQHLVLTKQVDDIISKESYDKIQQEIPAEVKKLVVKGDEEKTYENFRNNIKQDENNFLYRLLNYEHPFYSIKAISRLKGEQVNSSDLISLTYESNDPGMCYNTLKIAAEVFIANYAQIKKNLKSSAVKYFQNKLDDTYNKLNEAENNLLNFNIDNNVINYYEQTKQVTTQHEEIELRLQNEKMDYEASLAVLTKIESEISKRFQINLKNIEILKIRSQLVDCNNSISKYKINPELEKDNKAIELYKQKQNLEKKLELVLDSVYNFESSIQGLETQKILGEWLDAVKNLETNKAMLKSMQDRQAEFLLQFKRYAPLGANIKRIEREINVYENEYLNILNNLNIALQNEQNTDIISNMHIIDEAKFPISSLPSKKKLYLIISVLFSLIFYIGGLFIIELLDNRIKTPTLLNSLSNIEIAGAYSIPNNKIHKSAELIAEKANSFIYEKISSITNLHTKPYVIQIFSVTEEIEVNEVAESISASIQKRGFKVNYISLLESITKYNEVEVKTADNIPELLAQYYKSKSFEEFLKDDYHSVDFIINVLPSISHGIDNSILMQKADISLLVFDANLTWTSADIFNTEKIKALIPKNLYAILNNTMPNNLEEIYGELPKKRSKIRILSKKLLKRFVR